MMRVIAPEESNLDYLFLLGFLLIATVGNHPPIKVAFVILLLLFAFYLRKKDQRTSDLEKKYIALQRYSLGKTARVIGAK